MKQKFPIWKPLNRLFTLLGLIYNETTGFQGREDFASVRNANQAPGPCLSVKGIIGVCIAPPSFPAKYILCFLIKTNAGMRGFLIPKGKNED